MSEKLSRFGRDLRVSGDETRQKFGVADAGNGFDEMKPNGRPRSV